MHKTSVYTRVNGNIKELAHRKQQKSQKVILPASHWLTAFLFAVLLLKYCFPTGDQLERYCASDIFYSSQAA